MCSHIYAYQASLLLVWLDTADKEGLAGLQGLHEHVQGPFELWAKGGCFLASFS